MRRSDLGLLVIHALRLGGFADAETVASRVGGAPAEVERLLADAALDGLVRHRATGPSGWSLTDEGRKENERLLAEELDNSGLRVHLTEAYQRFLPLNTDLLATCTAWQVLDAGAGTLNDHTDPAYDRAVIERLIGIDRQIQPWCAELGAELERFAGYGPRLARAIERIEQGDLDWFTRPTIDSYHTVWFELHEDLLASLGLDRTSERQSAPDDHEPSSGSATVSADLKEED
ncbi:MAG: transcriptional regulator [Actinomycetota bacterium]